MSEKPTGNLIPLPESVKKYNRKWSQGYHDGYHDKDKQESDGAYADGYAVGLDDGAEDRAAILTGEVDHLSDSEREFLYGHEEKYNEYKERSIE